MKTACTNLGVDLRRIERDIVVQKRLRKQRLIKEESTADIDVELESLRNEATRIRNKIDRT